MMLLSIVGRFTTEDKFGKTLYQSIKGLIINSFGKKVWASLLYHMHICVILLSFKDNSHSRRRTQLPDTEYIRTCREAGCSHHIPPHLLHQITNLSGYQHRLQASQSLAV